MRLNIIDQLNDKIKSGEIPFSKTEIKIANYFQDNAKQFPFLSIHDIAIKLGIGKASIMRFCHKLGYDGFAALKRDISNFVKGDLAPLEKFKLLLEDPKLNVSSINQIAQNEVDNINFIINNFDEINFEKAVQMVCSAQNVFTMGISLSSHLANLTSYFLQRIGLKSAILNQMGLTFTDQLRYVNKQDVLIAFSLPPYSQETINAAEYMKKQSANVLAITNSITSPIIKFSDANLIVKTDSYFISNSLTPIFVLIIALINEIAVRNKDRSVKAIDEIISSR